MTARRGVLASVRGVALVGLRAHQVRVEACVTSGLPGLRLVGLPDAAVREAGDRARTAVQRCGLTWPSERIVVNLAPADLPKIGSSLDLPLALSVLVATGQIPLAAVADLWACGELGLDGSVRPVTGQLAAVMGARSLGASSLMLPSASAPEAALVEGIEVVGVGDLGEAVSVLRGDAAPAPVVTLGVTQDVSRLELADVRGQALAKRAVEVSAAGGHNLLLSGPPGCGKTMLAERLHGLLPPLGADAALEVAAVHSLAGQRRTDDALSLVPPLRQPHHRSSIAGLVGGGPGVPRPGELSLAHRGVLILDELLEAPRHVLDALRQPLESGEVVLTRAQAQVTYPARVLLVAATNPCPCGYLGSSRRECSCRPDIIERYRARLSGPFLDRLDLQVELGDVEPDHLVAPPEGETSSTVADRVSQARQIAADRWGPDRMNRDVPTSAIRATCAAATIRRLASAVEEIGGSARGFDRGLRVARTLADLDGCHVVGAAHVDEAVAYRLAPVEVT